MNKERPHLILDLDNTLISAEPTEEYDFSKNNSKSKKFIFHNMDGYYIVFERPDLQKFLTYIFDNFDVSVWTAASKDYALFIIDKIIIAGNKNRKLNYIFFSYHCDISESIKDSLKDLSLLKDTFKLENFSKNNTFIIDDLDDIYKTQPKNCIKIPEFEFTKEDSEGDNYLSKLISQLRVLLEKYNSGENVQKSIKNINKTL